MENINKFLSKVGIKLDSVVHKTSKDPITKILTLWLNEKQDRIDLIKLLEHKDIKEYMRGYLQELGRSSETISHKWREILMNVSESNVEEPIKVNSMIVQIIKSNNNDFIVSSFLDVYRNALMTSEQWKISSFNFIVDDLEFIAETAKTNIYKIMEKILLSSEKEFEDLIIAMFLITYKEKIQFNERTLNEYHEFILNSPLERIFTHEVNITKRFKRTFKEIRANSTFLYELFVEGDGMYFFNRKENNTTDPRGPLVYNSYAYHWYSTIFNWTFNMTEEKIKRWGFPNSIISTFRELNDLKETINLKRHKIING